MIHWLQTNWYTALLTAWTVINFVMNGVAQSLEAPTAQSSAQYKFWFKMVNYFALNLKRGNGTTIENSPNFIPAAEQYMQKRLTENGITPPPPPAKG